MFEARAPDELRYCGSALRRAAGVAQRTRAILSVCAAAEQRARQRVACCRVDAPHVECGGHYIRCTEVRLAMLSKGALLLSYKLLSSTGAQRCPRCSALSPSSRTLHEVRLANPRDRRRPALSCALFGGSAETVGDLVFSAVLPLRFFCGVFSRFAAFFEGSCGSPRRAQMERGFGRASAPAPASPRSRRTSSARAEE